MTVEQVIGIICLTWAVSAFIIGVTGVADDMLNNENVTQGAWGKIQELEHLVREKNIKIEELKESLEDHMMFKVFVKEWMHNANHVGWVGVAGGGVLVGLVWLVVEVIR